MKIVSDFHDYYDCVMRDGYDPTLIYIRKKKTIDNPLNLRSYSYYPFSKYVDKRAPRLYFIVGFCGKLYPIIQINNIVCYNIAEVNSVMDQTLKKKELVKYYKEKYDWGDSEKGFKKYFDNSRNRYQGLFEKHHTPIFVAKADQIVLNDSLKELEFYRIFDPYQAYQELTMFFGILGTHTFSKTKYAGKEMDSTVSDKDLIKAKGFDEHSFRREPRKKT